ncbi:GNAT family N-acetyltransferase [Paraburkholderia sp. J8-2]|uniref:GNAT family N-acetyltransferase n=1 Tax=Paraburkholderia sp. J8-2 TaxID=2805440 RepID=UPI002AB6ACF2|nr:GNAT family N-acetyltransferase [Paraburkholderia sp. J8-2]
MNKTNDNVGGTPPTGIRASGMRPVGIRPTTEEDWEILKGIFLAALSDSPTAFGLRYATAAAYSEQQWRDCASAQTQPLYLVALEQGQAVGLIGDGITRSHEYHLIAMWVHPKRRGMGIGGRLVNAIQARAIERGYRRVVLRVSPENGRAADLYRRHGFIFLPEWETLAGQPAINLQKMEWSSSR